MRLRRDVYRGRLNLNGEEHVDTVDAANNHAVSLIHSKRVREARALLCKALPVARRILGDNSDLTLIIRWNYATALYKDAGATLDDLREAVTTLEDTERTARRVFGGSHPTVAGIERSLRVAQAGLREREMLPG